MKIFLIGYMGSGKSTLGKLLAQALNLPFLDLDTHIEEKEGTSIPEIFKARGEHYFRELESDCLKTAPNSSFVMATGGGAPCFFDNMEWMNKNGLTVFLKVDAGTILNRLKKEKNQRPLISKLNDAELKVDIEKRLKQREEHYQKARLTIENTLEPDIQEIIKTIKDMAESD